MDATSAQDAKKIMEESDVPVVIDFFAEWCGPCKMLSPVIESLIPDYEGKVKIIKVNVDESNELAQENKVSSVPTIVFLKDGEEVDRMVGFQSKENLTKKFDELAG